VKKNKDSHQYFWTDHSKHLIHGVGEIRRHYESSGRNPEIQSKLKSFINSRKPDKDATIVLSDEHIGSALVMRGSYIGVKRNSMEEIVRFYGECVEAENIRIVQVTRKDTIAWLKGLYIKCILNIDVPLSFAEFASIYLHSPGQPLKLVNRNFVGKLANANSWSYKHHYLDDLNEEEKIMNLYNDFNIKGSDSKGFSRINSSTDKSPETVGAKYIVNTLTRQYLTEKDRLKDQSIIYNFGIPQLRIIGDDILNQMSQSIRKQQGDKLKEYGKNLLKLPQSLESEILAEINA